MNFAKINLFVAICVLSWAADPAAGQEVVNQTKFEIGDTIEFRSKILDESRVLNVYLPSTYADGDTQYPVIYLLDGSANEDFLHIAGLVQFGSFSWINMLPESIVVGIANVDRKRDFTFPTTLEQDKKEFPTSGGSAKFIQMLEQEIQPLVNTRYRTKSAKTLIGQSLGGLLATEILFKNTDLFDNYIIVSPSLWWDDQSLLNHEISDEIAEKAVFIGVGKEGVTMENLAKGLYKKLKAGHAENNRLWFEYFAELDHGDTLHLAVYDAFGKIFSKATKEPARD